jgi:folate-binding protein YgfZ
MTSPASRAFVVERVPRAVFSLTGEKPLGYLHDVLAQDVAGLTPGEGALAAVLTANARVAAEVRVLLLDDSVLLDAEEGARRGIEEHIARHAPLAGCEATDAGDRFALAAVRGSGVEGILRAAGLPIPGPTEASFAADGALLVVRVVWGGPGFDLLGPPDAVTAAVTRLDAPRATLAEFDAARIEAGRPLYGADVGEELLVNETPLLAHGVSMTKGCYPGQESVAKIHNLGRVRRALRSLRSAQALATGAAVLVDRGAPAGRVTSAATLPDGGGIAIALLAAEIEPGSAVTIEGIEAIVGSLP